MRRSAGDSRSLRTTSATWSSGGFSTQASARGATEPSPMMGL